MTLFPEWLKLVDTAPLARTALQSDSSDEVTFSFVLGTDWREFNLKSLKEKKAKLT